MVSLQGMWVQEPSTSPSPLWAPLLLAVSLSPLFLPVLHLPLHLSLSHSWQLRSKFVKEPLQGRGLESKGSPGQECVRWIV